MAESLLPPATIPVLVKNHLILIGSAALLFVQVVRALSVGVWHGGQARFVFMFGGGSSELSAWLGGGFKRCVTLRTSRVLVACARLSW